jgi:hypothetical protein
VSQKSQRSKRTRDYYEEANFPRRAEADLKSDAAVDGEDNDVVGSERVSEPAPTGTLSFTPDTRSSGSFASGECLEGEVVRIMQASKSAWSSELSSKENMEYRRDSFEIKRVVRHRELEQARLRWKSKSKNGEGAQGASATRGGGRRQTRRAMN